MRRAWTPGRTVLLGGITVGTLDILDAIIFFGMRGVEPVQVFHSIAAGLIGRAAATAGGLTTAALGLLLHFGIATTVVAIYFVVSRWLPFLVRHPVVGGILYGPVVFLVMNLVVLPLSAAHGTGTLPTGAGLVNGLLIHVVGIGLPAALFTARGRTGRWLGWSVGSV